MQLNSQVKTREICFPIELSLVSDDSGVSLNVRCESWTDILTLAPTEQLKILGFVIDSCIFCQRDLKEVHDSGISIKEFLSNPQRILLTVITFSGKTSTSAEMDMEMPDSWGRLSSQSQRNLMNGIQQFAERFALSVTNSIDHLNKEQASYDA